MRIEMVMNDWPYCITIENPDWYEVQLWCESTIGEFDRDWYKLGIDPAEYVIDGRTRTTWLFRKHEHAVLFKLKWA